MVTATNRTGSWLAIALMVLASFCVSARCEASFERDPFLIAHPRLSFGWSRYADLARWQVLFGDGIAHDADVAIALSIANSSPSLEQGLWMYLLSVPTELRNAEPRRSLIELARQSQELHAHLWLTLRYPKETVGRFRAEIEEILSQHDRFATTATCDGRWAEEVPYLAKLKDLTDEQMRTALSSPGAFAVLDAAWLQGINLYPMADDPGIRRLVEDYDMPARYLVVAGVLRTGDLGAYTAARRRTFSRPVSLGVGLVADAALFQLGMGETLLKCRGLYLERKAASRVPEFFTHIEPNTYDVKAWLLVRYHENLIPAVVKKGEDDFDVNLMLLRAKNNVARAPECTLPQVPYVYKEWQLFTQPARQ